MMKRTLALFRLLFLTRGLAILGFFFLEIIFSIYLNVGYWNRPRDVFFRDISIMGILFGAWGLSGYLGYVFNIKSSANWLRQLPFKGYESSFVPFVLMFIYASVIYFFVPGVWNMGTNADALPGTYIFIFAPVLTFYLVRQSRGPVLSFVTGGVLGIGLYIAIFLLLVKTARNPWSTLMWSPFQQMVFLGLAAILALIFEREGRRFALPLVVLLLIFGAETCLKPPSMKATQRMLSRSGALSR